MFNRLLKRLKSKTHRFGLLVLGLGMYIQAIPESLLREALKDDFGWVMVVISVGVFVFRELTHDSVDNK